MAKPTAVSHLVLAVVVWDDAWAAGTDIVTLADMDEKHRPSTMQTLGWILRQNEAGISIANERCLDKGDDSYRGFTFIPHSLIKSVTPFSLSTRRRSHAKTPRRDPDAVVV